MSLPSSLVKPVLLSHSLIQRASLKGIPSQHAVKDFDSDWLKHFAIMNVQMQDMQDFGENIDQISAGVFYC